MTRTLFLIGPSRIGKSTAAGYVAERLTNVRHHNLDDDVKPFRQPDVDKVITAQDWRILEPILTSYESGSTNLAIVDVGAGTQNMVEAGRREILDWLVRPNAFIVLITAKPSVSWVRWIEGHPEMEALGFDRFLQQEFTGRNELYGLAHHTIDATHRLATEVGEELLDIARKLAGPESGDALAN